MLEEWGFPGFVKVIEQRMGPFGRPMSTIFVLAVWLFVVIFVGKMVHKEIVQPVVNAVADENVSVDLMNLVRVGIVYGVGVIIWAAAMTAMHVFVFARTKRKIEQLQREG